MYNVIILSKKDNVAVAAMSIPAHKEINSNLKSRDFIPFGHKIALSDINKNDFIYKYGQVIGIASKNIVEGEHVHSHNLEFTEFERKFKINKQTNIEYKSENNFFLKGLKEKMEKPVLEITLVY